MGGSKDTVTVDDAVSRRSLKPRKTGSKGRRRSKGSAEVAPKPPKKPAVGLRSMIALSQGPMAVLGSGWVMLRTDLSIPSAGLMEASVAAVLSAAIILSTGWILLRSSWPTSLIVRRLSAMSWIVAVAVCALVWMGTFLEVPGTEDIPEEVVEVPLSVKEEAWADRAMVTLVDFGAALQTMESDATPVQKATVLSRFNITPPRVPSGVSPRTEVLAQSMLDLKGRMVTAAELFPGSPVPAELEALRITLDEMVQEVEGLGPPRDGPKGPVPED